MGGNPFWAWRRKQWQCLGALQLQRLLWLHVFSPCLTPVHPVQDKKTTLVCRGLAWSQTLQWLLCSWLCPGGWLQRPCRSLCARGSYFSLERPQPALRTVVGNTE